MIGFSTNLRRESTLLCIGESNRSLQVVQWAYHAYCAMRCSEGIFKCLNKTWCVHTLTSQKMIATDRYQHQELRTTVRNDFPLPGVYPYVHVVNGEIGQVKRSGILPWRCRPLSLSSIPGPGAVSPLGFQSKCFCRFSSWYSSFPPTSKTGLLICFYSFRWPFWKAVLVHWVRLPSLTGFPAHQRNQGKVFYFFPVREFEKNASNQGKVREIWLAC